MTTPKSIYGVKKEITTHIEAAEKAILNADLSSAYSLLAIAKGMELLLRTVYPAPVTFVPMPEEQSRCAYRTGLGLQCVLSAGHFGDHAGDLL